MINLSWDFVLVFLGLFLVSVVAVGSGPLVTGGHEMHDPPGPLNMSTHTYDINNGRFFFYFIYNETLSHGGE